VDLLDLLYDAPGLYVGRGDGVESGQFVGRLVVTPLPSGRGVTIDYEALSLGNLVQHVEHTLLALGPGGHPTLYVSHIESPTVAVMVEDRPGFFVDRDANGPARRAIEITADPVESHLAYGWWWAQDDAELVERSRVEALHVRQFMDRE
jgi:hypothetical protein